MLRAFFERCLQLLAELLPKQPNRWVFGSWFGQAYADNPKAVFEYVLRHAPHRKPVWVTFQRSVYAELKNQGLPVALAQSWIGKWYQLTAGVAVFATGYTTDFKASCIGSKTKKVQLWHGAGLKKIGQIPETSLEKPALYDLVATSSPALKQRAIDEFGVSATAAIVTGMPRLDTLTQTPQLNAISRQMARSRKLGETVVLCAFTHRFEAKTSVLLQLLEEAQQLSSELNEHGIKLFIKPHFYDMQVHRAALAETTYGEGPVVLVSSETIANDILSLFDQADFLITDFSSTFTDFLLTGKPVIFFDATSGMNHKNFYFDYATHTPGPKVKNWKECMDEIELFRKNPARFLAERQRMRRFFHQYTDGQNTQRVVAAIEQLVTNGRVT